MGGAGRQLLELLFLCLGHNYCQFIIWNKAGSRSRFYQVGLRAREQKLKEFVSDKTSAFSRRVRLNGAAPGVEFLFKVLNTNIKINKYFFLPLKLPR